MSIFDPAGLAAAAFAGDLKRIDALLDAGACANRIEDDSPSPLHAAIENWQPAALERLLARGADPNLPLWNGWTPLSHAIECELDEASGWPHRPRAELSPILISYGADVDAPVPALAPLKLREWLDQRGYREVTQLLTKRRPD